MYLIAAGEALLVSQLPETFIEHRATATQLCAVCRVLRTSAADGTCTGTKGPHCMLKGTHQACCSQCYANGGL